MVDLTYLWHILGTDEFWPDQMPFIWEQFFPRGNSLSLTHGRKANKAVFGYAVRSPLGH